MHHHPVSDRNVHLWIIYSKYNSLHFVDVLAIAEYKKKLIWPAGDN